MPQDVPPAGTTPHLCRHCSSLVWYFLDANLYKSALFYAEMYFALEPKNHDARHLYATALLEAGQPHSAHRLVNLPLDNRCTGCVDIVAKCCMKLGRHRQARGALDVCLQNPDYTPSRASLYDALNAPHASIAPHGRDFSQSLCPPELREHIQMRLYDIVKQELPR